jgi:glutathione S-transferase
MRARMAMDYAGIAPEYREISFSNKPPSMCEVSPKATVPVLVLPEGEVIDESRDIMLWSLEQNDPQNWRGVNPEIRDATDSLINYNDKEFKGWLDKYKYADRYPEHPGSYYRRGGEVFLSRLEDLLSLNVWLLGDTPGLADMAIFPFIRQFSMVDSDWFEQAAYPRLRQWLGEILESERFQRTMIKRSLWAF